MPLDELVVAGKTLAVSLFTIRYSVSGISSDENPPLTVEYQISTMKRPRQLIPRSWQLTRRRVETSSHGRSGAARIENQTVLVRAHRTGTS